MLKMPNTPVFEIVSATWYHSSPNPRCKEDTENFFKCCKQAGNDQAQLVYLKDSIHMSFSDQLLLMPIEMSFMEGPRIPKSKWHIAKQLSLNHWLHIDFLDKVGITNELANPSAARSKIESNEYMISYDKTFKLKQA